MIVIPVMDIRDGVVVHAKQGLRELYRPLSDSVYGTCDPLTLGSKFFAEGFRLIYVADLDSILGSSANERVLTGLRRLGLKVIADIGVTDNVKLEEAIRLSDYPVIATETAPNLSFLAHAFRSCSRAFLSLDVKSGVIISATPELAGLKVEEAIGILKNIGVSKVILIDFDRIGVYSGPDLSNAELLVNEGFEVYVGGGIRDLNDLMRLNEIGVKGALVGSALHFGRMSEEKLKELGYV